MIWHLKTHLVLAWCAFSAEAKGQNSTPSQLVFNPSIQGKLIENKFSDLNVSSVNKVWVETATNQSDDYFKRNFPFVRRVQLMGATGGNTERDLFIDPLDRTTVTDFKFDRLIAACANIVAKGLKPMVKTGWVPLKLSERPVLGGTFGTNLRPPADYDQYYTYIRAIVHALKDHFGLAELSTWSWGVGIEFENQRWFETEDHNPESTKLAYFKLYDYTEAALEDELGQTHFIIGAHSLALGQNRRFWDPRDFLEHCARDKNFRNGHAGTKLDFLGISYYTRTPGFNRAQFIDAVGTLQSEAKELGLSQLRFGVDEGRVLNGWDGKVLYPREVEDPIQAAGDAELFHLMVDHNIAYFSTWCVTTEGVFGGLPVASAHLRNLLLRLAGSSLVEASPSSRRGDVDGLAAYDVGSKKLRILLYRYSRIAAGDQAHEAEITISHVALAGELKAVCVQSNRLDEDHGNWGKAWLRDVKLRKIEANGFRSSSSTLYLPRELTNPRDVEFWESRVHDYAKISELKSEPEFVVTCHDHALSWRTPLKPNGIVLFELSGIELSAF